MRNWFYAFALCAAVVARPATAAAEDVDTKPLLLPVRAFVNAFNAMDLAYPGNAFTANCAIVDDFAPYTWSGPGAPRRWYAALVGATAQQHAGVVAQRIHFTVSAPRYARVANDRAYFVLPAT